MTIKEDEPARASKTNDQTQIPVTTATTLTDEMGTKGEDFIPTLVLPSNPVNSQVMEREGPSSTAPSVPPSSYDHPSTPPPTNPAFQRSPSTRWDKDPFTITVTKPSIDSKAGVRFRHNKNGYVILTRVSPDGLVAQQTDLTSKVRLLKINSTIIHRHMPISKVQSLLQEAEGEIIMQVKETNASLSVRELSEQDLATIFTVRKPVRSADVGLALEVNSDGYLIVGALPPNGLFAQQTFLVAGMRIESINGTQMEKGTPREDAMAIPNNAEEYVTVKATHMLRPPVVNDPLSTGEALPRTRERNHDTTNCNRCCDRAYCCDAHSQASCCQVCCECLNYTCCFIDCTDVGVCLSNWCGSLCSPVAEACDGCDICCQSGCSVLANGCECDGCGVCFQSGCEACGDNIESCCHCFYGCFQCMCGMLSGCDV